VHDDDAIVVEGVSTAAIAAAGHGCCGVAVPRRFLVVLSAALDSYSSQDALVPFV
jgi:hypothetical protein